MSKKAGLLAEIERLNGEVKEIFDAAGDDELSSQTWEKVKTNNKEIERLEGQVATLLEQEKAREEAASRGRLGTPKAAPERGGQAAAAKTIGQSVIDDPEFKRWLESREVVLKGSANTQIGSSPGVRVPGGLKTLITGASATNAGALVNNDYRGLVDMGTLMRPLTIRDLITIGSTDSDVVEYVVMSSFTNSAAPIGEATATSGSSGAAPESALGMTVVTQNVKPIAHWVPATRRALADAGQLRTTIDTFLRYGIDEELEDQILNGSGSGDNFTGLHNTSGITAQAYTTDLLTTLRQARTKVKVTGRAMPTAYVLHPNDWEDLDLLKDGENRYYYGGPSVLGNPRLWGLPVVESEAQTEGQGAVTDWRLVTLWDREATQIYVSDSHSDFFVRRIVAVLAEMRAAFGHLRPAAFVEIDLTA